MVIDSFVSRKKPAALRYLQQRGVDTADVTVVIASHWHDDHVRGLDVILERAPAARFVHPDVDDPDTLTEMAGAADAAARGEPADDGSQFGKVLAVLNRTGRQSRPVAGGTFFIRTPALSIIALSPTQAAKRDGMVAVGRALQAQPLPARRRGIARMPSPPKPNLTSLALWVETASHSALLGGDLEAHATYGWPAAIDESARLRLHGSAQLLKVPHHGSPNADHDRTWTDLLCDRPAGAVTPYSPSDLPRGTDIARLRSRCGRVEGAASEQWVLHRALPIVASAFPKVDVARRESFGFVRFTASAAGGWAVSRGFI
jgi:hypothetical protein